MAHDLNGIWLCDDSGVYYVYHFQNNVWWAGLSMDGEFSNGLRFSNVFTGVMSADGLIRGRWANVPRGTASEGGYLQLRVNYDSAGNAINFSKIPAGHSGIGSIWANRSEVGPTAPEIYSVFDKVKKNHPHWYGGYETLLYNLKPCKLFPVVVFGNIVSNQIMVNYRPMDGRSYKDFICLKFTDDDPPDGDLQFSLMVNKNLLPPDFWFIDGWQTGHKVTPEGFEAKLDYHHHILHCETIMYGGAARCEDDTHYNDPPLLPGWQQRGGNSVLINGLPIDGDLVISATEWKPKSYLAGLVHGFSLIPPKFVRLTGILVLDCGHANWHDPTPCYEDDPSQDNEEIHPVFAIDIIDPLIRDNLTGAWADRNGLTYYIRHVGSEVWWLATSPALDDRQASAFYGKISADQREIQGTLVNLPLGTLFQGKPPYPPQQYHLHVEDDRLTITLPEGTKLIKLYDRDKGHVQPLDPTHPQQPPVEKNPRV